MIARDKEMYVIGHYHVAPNHHVMPPLLGKTFRRRAAQSVTKNKGESYLWNMRSSRNGWL
jgi:hypothetical protein